MHSIRSSLIENSIFKYKQFACKITLSIKGDLVRKMRLICRYLLVSRHLLRQPVCRPLLRPLPPPTGRVLEVHQVRKI